MTLENDALTSPSQDGFREESHPRRARHRDRCLELERHDGLVQVERHLHPALQAPDELPLREGVEDVECRAL